MVRALQSLVTFSANLTSYDLPDDVFEPGEKRPVKEKKKKAKAPPAELATSKKRSMTEAGIQVRRKLTGLWLTLAPVLHSDLPSETSVYTNC